MDKIKTIEFKNNKILLIYKTINVFWKTRKKDHKIAQQQRFLSIS